MYKKEYRAMVRTVLDEIIKLVESKNSDYSHGDDPFANFRISEQVGVDPLVGLWIRMEDKFQRVRAYLNRGDLKVAGEGIDDAFRDIIGYSLLAIGMLHERDQKKLELIIEEASKFESGDKADTNVSQDPRLPVGGADVKGKSEPTSIYVGEEFDSLLG